MDPISSPALGTPQPICSASAGEPRTRLVSSEFAFLRFTAGMRAMLAALGATILLNSAAWPEPRIVAVLLPYLVWTALLLWRTLHGWPRAGSKAWLWIDAAVLMLAYHTAPAALPGLAAITVLPVVAMALMAGSVHAIVLAVACALAMLSFDAWQHGIGESPTLALSLPIVLLAFGPVAALLTRQSHELRQRLQLLDAFNQRSDPRQGLRHHIDVLFDLLGAHFGLSAATISLQGPEPRLFQWHNDARVQVLHEPEARVWRDRLAELPHDLGCAFTLGKNGEGRLVALNPRNGTGGTATHEARRALAAIGPNVLALPLMTYGQPLGHVCLSRAAGGFTEADLLWLHDVMRETLPLLERSDLLEQLQRESAAGERERIGRDLHDSAIQPYLGLKYGLEALARQAGPQNPVNRHIQQLLQLATGELQTLRDMVGGLRRGEDPTSNSPSLAALHRQAERFETLYGLKVNIFAPQAPHLRGSAAQAVLHMVNEALTNVRRHTTASAVTVMLDVRQTDLVLRLRNDGGPGETLPTTFAPRSLIERAAEFGGSVAVSHEASFTEIAITLPLLGTIG